VSYLGRIALNNRWICRLCSRSSLWAISTSCVVKSLPVLAKATRAATSPSNVSVARRNPSSSTRHRWILSPSTCHSPARRPWPGDRVWRKLAALGRGNATGAAGVLLASVFVVSSAFAAEPDGKVRIEDVKFQDLNLDTAAGVDALYKRIHAAAERVCAVSEQEDLGAFAGRASAKCTKDAEARAIEEINLPALTALTANR
jgi:UrcA family protein